MQYSTIQYSTVQAMLIFYLQYRQLRCWPSLQKVPVPVLCDPSEQLNGELSYHPNDNM